MRIERRDFLVELGTEELPPKALRLLERSFAEGLRARLTQAGLAVTAIESFATPRRLAVVIRRLAARQPDQSVKRRGPPLRVCFDAAGAPTRAAVAFADSMGVALEALGRERDAKGEEYLSFEGVKHGAQTVTLLPGAVQQSLDALPIPKRMRWGAGEAQFVRPVHWLVMLFGTAIVPATILDVPAGRHSLGHRFMSAKPLRISSPRSYANTLLTRGKVIAAFDARRANIRSQVEALAEGLGGAAVMPDALLDEVTSLVEWPVAIAGQFEPRFLALPREVLIATLQEHQRYFALQSVTGALLPWFITISNIDSPAPELVRAGNERVVRPRLADATFFWEQDRKQPLAARRAGLDAVTFQAQLGSVGQRTQRVDALSAAIAPSIGADSEHTARAAQLSKCDLLTAMVGEFPELQGIVGCYYALADGEAPTVAAAIREHYLPRGAGDELPASPVGDALALADKLDTIAGSFAIGQKPSGTRDPFGLRRAAIGILRIVLEHRLELDLLELIRQAVELQPPQPVGPQPPPLQPNATISDEIYDFILERLRAQYLERAAESGISSEMFDAVLATRPASLLDFDARLRALVGFVAQPEGASLAAANKRIANILKKSDSAAAQAVAIELLREPAERELYRAVQALRPAVTAALSARAYQQTLSLLAGLRPQVDEFFDRVLVNDADNVLRNNRLALLADLHALFGGIADLSRLPG